MTTQGSNKTPNWMSKVVGENTATKARRERATAGATAGAGAQDTLNWMEKAKNSKTPGISQHH
jgi:hypothetical protein